MVDHMRGMVSRLHHRYRPHDAEDFNRFADVLHSVQPVTSGYRIVLTYNLVAKGVHAPPSLQSLQVHVNQVRRTLKKWKKTSQPEFLVYTLQHEYTHASLRASALKGLDVHRVQCIMHLQKELGLRLCLGSLEKEVFGNCEGTYNEYNGWSDGEDEDEDDGHHHIDEEIESSFKLKNVVDLDGNVVIQGLQVWWCADSSPATLANLLLRSMKMCTLFRQVPSRIASPTRRTTTGILAMQVHKPPTGTE